MFARYHEMGMKKAVAMGVVFLTMAGAAWAADSTTGETEYDRPVTQTEFATGVVAAILNQPRVQVDDAEAMLVLKDRGLVPAAWTGSAFVMMSEAEETFHYLGVQLYVEDGEELLSSGVFEQILRRHLGEIKRTKHHWDIVHHFSLGLTIGEYRQRVISPSGF